MAEHLIVVGEAREGQHLPYVDCEQINLLCEEEALQIINCCKEEEKLHKKLMRISGALVRIATGIPLAANHFSPRKILLLL